MPTLDLVSGDALVRVAPDIGGAIVAYTLRGHPVLRPTPGNAFTERNVRLASCYPLVPWSNRIRDGRLAFAGRTHALTRNFGAHPHAIHGVGWQREWDVDEASTRCVRLALTHDARGASAWPWPFRAMQTFALAEAASDARAPFDALLTVTLTLENAGRESFPFGLGWHPFFPKRAATKVEFAADRVFENDATQLPLQHVAIPAPWRFDRPRALDDLALDNVFTGWRGTATLLDPATGLRTTLSADRACRYLVVYAPAGGEFIALEPVTHETDAFNRHAQGATCTGFRTLAPGGSFSCTMRVAASVPDRPATPAR